MMKIKIMSLSRDVRSNRKGAVIVEFAFVSVLYIAFMIGIFVWALTFWMQGGAQFLAERAARCVMLKIPTSSTGSALPRKCDPYQNAAKQNAAWVPGIRYDTANLSDATKTSIQGGETATVRSYLYGGTTATNYNSYCIQVRAQNPFIPGKISGTITIPFWSGKLYCRPAP